jgi:signal transduction histidine kinase/CheY-like chemotaxis protein
VICLAHWLLVTAAILQAVAVVYGLWLLSRREGAAGAWLFLLGAMLSMLAWRLVTLAGVEPPAFFNPLIAIWGSTCMVGAMSLFGREVARRRATEAERDALLESERAARGEAERASRLKDDFVATLSHELRSPLAAILGWCSVLRRSEARRDEVDRALEVIERNARTQANLVEDLLDVTRLQAGALQLESAPLSLDAPVRAALQAVRPSADARSIRLELECARVPPRVRGDASRLQQVVTNLLVNAVKFTPPGGTVTVAVGAVGARAQLTVRDSGEGIDADFLPHVFTRFRQADGTATRRHGGLGLGLSIVEQLVGLHGGEVHASSAGRGRGATFTVTLPLAPAEGAAAAELERPEPGRTLADAGAPGASLEGLCVLLIDDEPDVRTAVSQLLEQAGARVVALASGEAIEAALRSAVPDLLLVDIGMPGEDGYTLMRRVRRLPPEAGGTTPAISLTAHARNEDRVRALAAGFDDHLPKPIEVAALVQAVRARARPAPAPAVVA